MGPTAELEPPLYFPADFLPPGGTQSAKIILLPGVLRGEESYSKGKPITFRNRLGLECLGGVAKEM